MQYPKLKLFLREDLTDVCLDRLLASALDAALIALPHACPPASTTLPLFDDEFLFVTADPKPGSAHSPLPIDKIEPEIAVAGGWPLPA
ncbi:LysR substrate-binding domain-containing protein [Casimicrobium huifangae]|uniref:LysR substrate-binding domain-containing protein n=1 Tax=Casimicrobium huifangae TaxID=2591109 RepID=UPI003782D3C1